MPSWRLHGHSFFVKPPAAVHRGSRRLRTAPESAQNAVPVLTFLSHIKKGKESARGKTGGFPLAKQQRTAVARRKKRGREAASPFSLLGQETAYFHPRLCFQPLPLPFQPLPCPCPCPCPRTSMTCGGGGGGAGWTTTT